MTGPIIARVQRRQELKRIARRLAQADKRGKTFIAVDYDLLPKVRVYIWQLQVDRANEKWARATHDVTLTDWQTATRRNAASINGDTVEPF